MLSSLTLRQMGAMDQVNPDMFTHTFTSEMNFRSKFEKMKCFRVMDNDGNIITPGYDT
jgi:hypothetical protein